MKIFKVCQFANRINGLFMGPVKREGDLAGRMERSNGGILDGVGAPLAEGSA